MLKSLVVGREAKSRHLFNAFIAISIFTILGIRAFLAIAGYPSLGSDSLHIAHMLWGGLLMLFSLIVLLYLHGFQAKFFAAILGGIGFGFFIDELGKFVTNDNNYFYQPAAMLIYIIFLLIWASLSRLALYQPSSRQQHAVDAFSKYRDAMIYGLSSKDIPMLGRQLKEAGCNANDVKHLMRLVDELAPHYNIESIWPKYSYRIQSVRSWIYNQASRKHVEKLLLSLFLVHVVVSVAILAFLVRGGSRVFNINGVPDFIYYGYVVSVAIYCLCIFVGAYYFIERNSVKVFVWYRRALLINVFVTQIFLFYINQFQAAFGLLLNLALLLLVDVIVRVDKTQTDDN